MHLSPVGPDIVAKQKGQWFCLELGQEGKKSRKPEIIVPFRIRCFLFSDVRYTGS